MDLAEKKPITDDATKIIKQPGSMDKGRAIAKLDLPKRNLGLKDWQEIAGLSIKPI